MLQAERKGASASEYGLVFGIFELASFISSPILGKYVSDTMLLARLLLVAHTRDCTALNNRVTCRVKFSCARHEGVKGSRGIAPRIFNLRTRYSFASQLL